MAKLAFGTAQIPETINLQTKIKPIRDGTFVEEPQSATLQQPLPRSPDQAVTGGGNPRKNGGGDQVVGVSITQPVFLRVPVFGWSGACKSWSMRRTRRDRDRCGLEVIGPGTPAVTIVTSKLPFDEWTSVFGSERLTGALLDRTHASCPNSGDEWRQLSTCPQQAAVTPGAARTATRRRIAADGCRRREIAQAKRPPMSEAFLLASLLHFCSGKPLQNPTGVDRSAEFCCLQQNFSASLRNNAFLRKTLFLCAHIRAC